MKLTSTVLILAAVAAPLAAQTTTHTSRPAGATAARPSAAAAACAKTPEISPKIPALPATASCVKHLYTITTVPSVKLDYVSPMEGTTLKEELGIEPTTFSLDYVDTKVGTGELAGAHTWYTINYTGYLTDGTKFDSSFDHGDPINIHYGEHMVIAGWDTGFGGMRVGGRRRLFIPYQLGYGAAGKGPIPAKATLIFDVELVAMSATQPPPKTPPTPPTPSAGTPKTPTGTTPPPPPATTTPSKPAVTPPPAAK